MKMLRSKLDELVDSINDEEWVQIGRQALMVAYLFENGLDASLSAFAPPSTEQPNQNDRKPSPKSPSVASDDGGVGGSPTLTRSPTTVIAGSGSESFTTTSNHTEYHSISTSASASSSQPKFPATSISSARNYTGDDSSTIRPRLADFVEAESEVAGSEQGKEDGNGDNTCMFEEDFVTAIQRLTLEEKQLIKSSVKQMPSATTTIGDDDSIRNNNDGHCQSPQSSEMFDREPPKSPLPSAEMSDREPPKSPIVSAVDSGFRLFGQDTTDLSLLTLSPKSPGIVNKHGSSEGLKRGSSVIPSERQSSVNVSIDLMGDGDISINLLSDVSANKSGNEDTLPSLLKKQDSVDCRQPTVDRTSAHDIVDRTDDGIADTHQIAAIDLSSYNFSTPPSTPVPRITLTRPSLVVDSKKRTVTKVSKSTILNRTITKEKKPSSGLTRKDTFTKSKLSKPMLSSTAGLGTSTSGSSKVASSSSKLPSTSMNTFDASSKPDTAKAKSKSADNIVSSVGRRKFANNDRSNKSRFASASSATNSIEKNTDSIGMGSRFGMNKQTKSASVVTGPSSSSSLASTASTSKLPKRTSFLPRLR